MLCIEDPKIQLKYLSFDIVFLYDVQPVHFNAEINVFQIIVSEFIMCTQSCVLNL